MRVTYILQALLDDGQQHLANQNETIHRLTRSLRQKDEQLEKMLELSSLADVRYTNTYDAIHVLDVRIYCSIELFSANIS